MEPFLQLLDRDVIERLAAGAAREQRAADVDHVRRARAFVDNGGAAVRAEATRHLGRGVFITRERSLALRDAETRAPASDIGGVGGAMRAAARGYDRARPSASARRFRSAPCRLRHSPAACFPSTTGFGFFVFPVSPTSLTAPFSRFPSVI